MARLAFVTLLCVLAVGAPAQAGIKAIWGPARMPDGSSAFPVYKDLGVDMIEEQVSWRDIAITRPVSPRDPADPAYRWPGALDAMVNGATASGIRVALLVKRTPRWAGGRNGARVPTRARDYADFLVAAARRYPQVRHWMIWGEPTRVGSFAPMPRNRRAGPRAYAVLLDAAYRALKRERRSNVVIGGMTWTLGKVTPPDFLRWMRLPNGRRPRLDWYGHNPFSARIPKLSQDTYYKGLRDFSDIDTLAAEVRRAYPRRRPKLWLSEFTVQSEHASYAFSFYVSPKAQAAWVRAAYRIAARTPYVAGVGWWTLLDGPEARGRAQERAHDRGGGAEACLRRLQGRRPRDVEHVDPAVHHRLAPELARHRLAPRSSHRRGGGWVGQQLRAARRPAPPDPPGRRPARRPCARSARRTPRGRRARRAGRRPSPRAASSATRPRTAAGRAAGRRPRRRRRTAAVSPAPARCRAAARCRGRARRRAPPSASAPPPAIVTLIRSGPASLAAATSVSSPCASPIVPA